LAPAVWWSGRRWFRRSGQRRPHPGCTCWERRYCRYCLTFRPSECSSRFVLTV